MNYINLIAMSFVLIFGSCNKNPLGKSSGSTFFYASAPGAFSIENSSVGDSFIQVDWGNAALADSYTVLYKEVSQISFDVASVAATSPYRIQGLLNDQTYLIKVVAKNFSGETSAEVISLTPTSSIGVPSITYAGIGGTSGTFGAAYLVNPGILDLNGGTLLSCIISPALPSGLALNNSSCAISGTPSSLSSIKNYIVTLETTGGSASANVSVEILPGRPTLSYIAGPQSAALGQIYALSPSIFTNGAAITSCATSPALPAGLSINSSTCVITGTPTSVLASNAYSITATNSAGSSTPATVSLSVSGTVPTLSYIGSTGVVNKIGDLVSITPSTLTNGGSAITSCGPKVPLSALPSWATVNPSTCVVSGFPDTLLNVTTYTLVATNTSGDSSDASLTLTVNANIPLLSFSGATGTTGGIGSLMTVTPTTLNTRGASLTNCTISPELPSTLSIDSSTCVISGTPTSVLISTAYSITATNSVGASAAATVSLSVTSGVPGLSYLGSTGTSGTFGTLMTVSPSSFNNGGLAITGCTVSPALPGGLSINSSTCVISGTPTASIASTAYSVTATNSSGSSIPASVTLAIMALTPTISYTAASASVGMAYSSAPTLTTGGAPITNCVVTPTLPEGLLIDTTTCVISGTPTSLAASTTYSIVATNSAGDSSPATISFAVLAGVPILSYVGASGTSGTVGSGMSISPTSAIANGAAITSCISSPSLPSGLTINATTCVISGTPTTAIASTVYSVIASNSGGSSTAATVTLIIAASVPSLSYSASTGKIGNINLVMSVSPSSFSNGGSTLTNCTISPSLPAGLSIGATNCLIGGVPTSVLSDTTYSVIATNVAGNSTAASVTLSVIDSLYLNFAVINSGFNGKCLGPFKVSSINGSGLFTKLLSDTVINLNSDSSANDYFYDDASCSGAPVSTTTVSSGQYVSANFYYMTDTAGAVTITASAISGSMIEKSTTISVGEKIPNTWYSFAEISVAPIARYGHSAVWTGSEMIIWGGVVAGVTSITGGRYNPVTDTWGAATPTTGVPSARYWHSAVWTGAEMIIWGGDDAALNTGGRYNPVTNTWGVATSTTGAPTGRNRHSAVWTGSEMIIWGGNVNTGGRYNPATNTWGAATSLTGVPSVRVAHSAVWTGSEMIIWGGNSLSTGGRYNPVTNTWGAATSTTGAPTGRGFHSAVWTGSEMIIWGAGSPIKNNTGGRYNPVTNTWGTATSTTGAPTARGSHSAVWTGAEMITWGGENSTSVNTGGRYNPVTNTWGAATSTTVAPAVRMFHSAVWTGSEMIIWSGNGVANTGERYNPATNTWGVATSTIGAPTSRWSHSAVWSGSEMIIWGGTVAGANSNTGGRYNPVTNIWGAATSTTGAPTARKGHTAVWTGSEMLIWGGMIAAETNTGGRYNPVTDTWGVATSTTGAPTARFRHSAVWTGSEMIIWGGNVITGGRYNPATNTWGTATATSAGVPSSRESHSAVWTGSEMIIWGGFTTAKTNSGGRYDPVTNTWGAATSTMGAPAARAYHSAVWSGSEMMIWGGDGAASSAPVLFFP